MRPPTPRYSFDQIMNAGRWAWASSEGDGVPDLYFDGHRFWQQREGRVSSLAPAGILPREGWWHATDCLCELCRPPESDSTATTGAARLEGAVSRAVP
ncbi:MAG: hypothetical protein GX624_02745 [Actinobacteria bacterium]|nr:hypothetical protein [Actinomycetota bacterium]